MLYYDCALCVFNLYKLRNSDLFLEKLYDPKMIKIENQCEIILKQQEHSTQSLAHLDNLEKFGCMKMYSSQIDYDMV